jgi:hypothetical protein
MHKTTAYFRNEVLRKRSYITLEMCRSVLKHPIKKEVQDDSRIRYWGKFHNEAGKYLRVVTLEDSETLHNAFLDRGFKRREEKKYALKIL